MRLKINLLLAFLLVFFILILGKLFSVSVLGHNKFEKLAENQHWTSYELPARRGDIFSSDGYLLATTEILYMLYGEPRKISNNEEAAEELCLLLNEDSKKCVSDIKEKLSLDLSFLILRHGISHEIKNEIQFKNISGIGFEEEPKRSYPENKLLGSVLGFVAKDETGKEQGYFGLEGFYNGDLEGRSGRMIEEKDAFGVPIPYGEFRKITPSNGSGLVTTIDRSLQYLVENKIKEGVKRYEAKSGTIIIMEPTSGAILAMANYPFSNPLNPFVKNEVSKELDLPLWNTAISSSYEPGSVVKALTAATGLEIRAINEDSHFYDGGPMEIGGYTIDTWDGKHYGDETVASILQHSNNIGAAMIGQKIGVKNLRAYFTKFGLGKISGIDLEGEAAGELKEISDWYPIDLATASFGQGLSVTPLQITSAFSAIVNNGILMRPKVVKELRKGNIPSPIQDKKIGKVLSPVVSKKMIELLTKAVAGGESKYFNLPNYKVAGKTGTAQIPVDGKYDPTLTNATFIGFFPSSQKFVMLVKVERPGTSPYAAETAVPLWMETARELALYFGISPDL